MRIAVASSGLGHVARGIEAWASDLGCALAARGEAVTLCKGGGQAETAFERVLPCLQRCAPRTQSLLRWVPRRFFWRFGLSSTYGMEQTSFALSLIRYLQRERIDLLHVQDPWVALLTQRAHQFGLIRARTILAHGTDEALAFQQKIDYLQHLAPWHREEARAQGVWKPTWTAIPNFIDTEIFSPGNAPTLRQELAIPADAWVVLSVAAIKRTHKRIDYLLAEFAQLRRARPDWPLWLVIAGGEVGETAELVQLGRDLLADRVRFLVQFPRRRMPELYRMADLFALCSLKEMMPIALLEATACGLPCVVHRQPVLEWMIGAGGAALPMHEPGALAVGLAATLDDSWRRRHWGRLARQHCVAQFSRERVVAQILDYYRFVLGQERARTLASPSKCLMENMACVRSQSV